MAIPIIIPRLGWDMEEGIFLGWLKPEGAQIRPGDTLFSLEGDKATEDVECLDEGILRIAPDGPRAGDKLKVGTVIAHLVHKGEEAPPIPTRRASEAPVRRQSDAGSVVHVAAAESGSKPAISPRAKRAAAELGVDWSCLQGSGRTGRIRECDVRAAVASRPAEPDRMRRTIAQSMLNSHRLTAPVTLTTTADATNLVNLRRRMKTGNEPVPSYTDLVVQLLAMALRKHPRLNASWAGEKIIVSPAIHIGIAVDVEDGLLVPVLRDVPSLSLPEIAARSGNLIERARQRRLKAEEMEGATFTVTNLGAFGVDAFTPIIHYPQCAILGLGRIQRRPVVMVVDGAPQILPRDVVTLSLTFDHRIVDGAPAARFLQTLSGLIEDSKV